MGALLPAPARLAVWAVAIAVDGTGARFGWPVPKLGPTPQTHLRMVGEHIAERYRQIYIISLGTLLLLGGLGYSDAGFDLVRSLAFVVAFANAALMLWSYFLPAGRSLGAAVDTTAPRIAVAAGYCHGIMIAGTVASAAGAVIPIRSPLGQTHPGWSLVIIGGTLLHVVGRTIYGVVMFDVRRPWRGPVAFVVIGAATPGLLVTPPLVVAIAVNLVLLCPVLTYRVARVPYART